MRFAGKKAVFLTPLPQSYYDCKEIIPLIGQHVILIGTPIGDWRCLQNTETDKVT
jgi:hypothetical protein